MRRRLSSFRSLVPALAALATAAAGGGTALAQLPLMPAPDGLTTVAPTPLATMADPSPLPPLVAATAMPHWTGADAHALLRAIRGAEREGLEPRDYHPESVEAALATGEGVGLDLAANAALTALAHDYLFGRVADRSTMGWRIARTPEEAARLPDLVAAAVATGRIGAFLDALLPSDARYLALRDALARTADPATRDRLRVNLERARWLPRGDPRQQIYVNVPSYRLRVVSDGVALSTYTVVVGAKDTPTPQLITPTSSLVVNPWWNVPASIVRKDNLRPGRPGFKFVRQDGGNWAVRQPPGPRNALGRIKFNLVNDQAIYLHDTPAKAGFGRTQRALSHGCIRVKDIDRLAAELMNDGGSEAALDDALATPDTTTVRLPQTWPVFIVYFTADLDEAGTLVSYPDTYGYDAQVLAGLGGGGVEIASRD